ncbi:MAG: hypothetical protein AABX00_00130 [Nanoarchaeota archaeon]
MNQSNKELDLKDADGKLNLASALRVNQSSVNGLWKQIRKSDETSRIVVLEVLAAKLARDFEFVSNLSEREKLDFLARMYKISPRAVIPLVDYSGSRADTQKQELEGGRYFNS